VILQGLAALAAILSFSLLLNAPKRELIFCGLTGSLSWLVYYAITHGDGSKTLAAFAATLAVTYLCRILAYRRKMPITIFLLAAIMPLVPGAGAYYTMLGLVTGDVSAAVSNGLDCIKMAGSIGIGIIIVLSLPRKLVLAA
jgi:uncharacterized membrane protein YjjB (DUF3815 family)